MNGWLDCEKSSGKTSTAIMITVVRNATAMPIGKPTASARSERRASLPCRFTSATDRPASGPNSGPTTMAPTIRIGWSRTIPTTAICIAAIMKRRS